MAHSVINIVQNELPLEFEDIRNAMDVPNEVLFQSISNKFLSIHTMNSVTDCLIKVNENGTHNFNIFLSSEKSHAISKGNPSKIHEEIKDKISNFLLSKTLDIPAMAAFFFTHKIWNVH